MMANRLKIGFKLMQPWAKEVAIGRLKFLIRSFDTYKRGRVAIIASKSIDMNWFVSKNTSSEDIKDYLSFGVLGSVKIRDCIEIKTEDAKKTLIKLGGEKYWKYYPKYLIPLRKEKKKIFIWILDEAKCWNEPIKLKNDRSMGWVKLNLINR